MAAKTPSTVQRESVGSVNLLVTSFADIDNGDTYDSGLNSVVGYWANGTDVPTQTNEGIDVGESAGVFTFSTGEDNRAVTLYILVRD
jgi:hypothetical protein